MFIIDRRLNPSGKSLSNRERFLRRNKELIARKFLDRKISDTGAGDIDMRDLSVDEPTLHRGTGGVRERILPGNKEYLEDDTIARPHGGGSGQGSGTGEKEGGGEDPYLFPLSEDEWKQLFFGDLELPNMERKGHLDVTMSKPHRSGYSRTGSPQSVALRPTMMRALARQRAMGGRPKAEEVDELAKEIQEMRDQGVSDEIMQAKCELLAALNRRRELVPYIDPIDLRYRRFESEPQPITQAVMFCLMDVSGSMSEEMKANAKRFYKLLYVFLKKQYKRVDIVFIRHTDKAEAVDEDTFFNSRETGGTRVSTALEVMAQEIATKYPSGEWNIYGAEASDGDNEVKDNPICMQIMQNKILPACQHFAYIEVSDPTNAPPKATNLWKTYESINNFSHLAMRRVQHKKEILPVFRDLFKRRESGSVPSSAPVHAAAFTPG